MTETRRERTREQVIAKAIFVHSDLSAKEIDAIAPHVEAALVAYEESDEVVQRCQDAWLATLGRRSGEPGDDVLAVLRAARGVPTEEG